MGAVKLRGQVHSRVQLGNQEDAFLPLSRLQLSLAPRHCLGTLLLLGTLFPCFILIRILLTVPRHKHRMLSGELLRLPDL